MMLQALVELAGREHLTDDPAFAPNRVDYVLLIDREGRLLSLLPTHDESGKARRMIVPRLPKRSVQVVAGTLVDNAKYVLGFENAGDDRQRNEVRLAACKKAFVDNLARLESASDIGVQAVRLFLEDASNLQRIQQHRREEDWTGSEVLAFQLEGDSGLVHERPAVRDALTAAAAAEAAGARQGVCLVTGRRGSIARLHPAVKGLPDQQTSGATLVTFNSSAFSSHGLEQGENAPVGVEAANAYVAALNWLLERPAPTARRPHRQGIRLGNSVLVFWTREPDQTVDLVAGLFDPDPAEMRAAFESPLEGIEKKVQESNAFYALTLSAHSRVIIRDWLETTSGEVLRNLRQYWDDIRLAPDDNVPRPLWALLASLGAPGREGLPRTVAAKMLRCALSGTPFPRELLGAALRRLRLPAGRNERSELRDRCCMIKAILNRRNRAAHRKEIAVSLDPQSRESPYLLGRLFAVLERLQAVALGDVNASIRDRYFGSAAATPGLVFPRLLKLSVHHAAKSEAGWLEKWKAEIVDMLPAQKFPMVLSLDEQGLFAIGYYHQRQELWRPKSSTQTQEVTQ